MNFPLTITYQDLETFHACWQYKEKFLKSFGNKITINSQQHLEKLIEEKGFLKVRNYIYTYLIPSILRKEIHYIPPRMEGPNCWEISVPYFIKYILRSPDFAQIPWAYDEVHFTINKDALTPRCLELLNGTVV